jgi:hypothetical protein
MHRQAREWIIAIEVMKLERRQALESARGVPLVHRSAQTPSRD